jgi:ABC-type phosphate/phosphonate transport system permease subunit
MSDIKIPQAKEFFETIKIRETSKDIKVEFLSRIVTIVIAGLALVTALAWDEVLKDVYGYLKEYIHGINEKLGYAIFITVFSVIVSVLLARFFIKKKRQVIEEE